MPIPNFTLQCLHRFVVLVDDGTYTCTVCGDKNVGWQQAFQIEHFSVVKPDES